MSTPSDGRNTIDYLLGRGRLERIDGRIAGDAAATIIGRATRRLLTADGGLAAGDVEGAFAAAYDAYRMAAEALLRPPRRCSSARGCALLEARART